MDIGSRIRSARKRAGLSQEAVARRAGMSVKGMGDIERGDIADPHYSSLAGIAEALGVSVGELLGESVPLAPAPSTSPPPDVAADSEAGQRDWEALTALVDGLVEAGNEEVLEQVWRVLGEERNRLALEHVMDDPENPIIRREFLRHAERLAYATLKLVALREARTSGAEDLAQPANSSSASEGDGGRIS